MENDDAKPGPSADQELEGAVGGAAADVNMQFLPNLI